MLVEDLCVQEADCSISAMSFMTWARDLSPLNKKAVMVSVLVLFAFSIQVGPTPTALPNFRYFASC